MLIDDLIEAARKWNNTRVVDLEIAVLVQALYDECGARKNRWSRQTRLESNSGHGYLMRIKGPWRGAKLGSACWEDVEFCPRLAALPEGARVVIGRAFLDAVRGKVFEPRVQYGCARY